MGGHEFQLVLEKLVRFGKWSFLREEITVNHVVQYVYEWEYELPFQDKTKRQMAIPIKDFKADDFYPRLVKLLSGDLAIRFQDYKLNGAGLLAAERLRK